jgi:D-arabinose 1-dehydrogenase-like Zn-dependent alcohol dehydrogenase
VLGYVATELVAPMVELVLREVAVLGSRSSTRADLRAALDLVATGRVRPVIGERLDLDDVNGALARLRDGTTVGRPVVEFA